MEYSSCDHNTYLCFGIDLGDQESPWEDYAYGLEEWYCEVNGTEFDKKRIDDCPYAEVEYGQDKDTKVLALRSTVLVAYKNSVERFDPEKLKATQEMKDTLLGFCAKHGLDAGGSPGWYFTGGYV